MEKLRNKLKDHGGFTLIEMLIVVAIIAILIAIAIPMVNQALERAREATDSANERAATGLAMVAYMTYEPTSADATATGISTAGGTAYYIVEKDADSGTDSFGRLVKTATFSDVSQYGKGTLAGEIKKDNTGRIIKVTVTPATAAAAEVIEIDWVDSIP